MRQNVGPNSAHIMHLTISRYFSGAYSLVSYSSPLLTLTVKSLESTNLVVLVNTVALSGVNVYLVLHIVQIVLKLVDHSEDSLF